jgi:signal peptidase I
MPQSILMRWFCRVYLVMLYAYPREFRLQFGGEMQQLFRDRCRQMTRTPGRWHWLGFALRSAADWMSTMFQERMAAVRQLTVQECTQKTFQVVRTVWSVGRQTQPRGFVAEWAMTLIVFLFATTTLVQAYVVPTGSMEGTVMIGDHMLVDRMTFANPGSSGSGLGSHLLPYRDVQRGDIVCFHYPEDVRQIYVKRVIGIPGDRIHMENKQVVRNGQHLIEPYTQHIDPMIDPYRDDFPRVPQFNTTPRGRDMLAEHVRGGELVVPPGTLFVMGDNRENSEDSRYWGLVPRGYVVGKPVLVYWSYDAPTADFESWSLGHVVDVMTHFFTRTRWNRTFLVPRTQQAKVAP